MRRRWTILLLLVLAVLVLTACNLPSPQPPPPNPPPQSPTNTPEPPPDPTNTTDPGDVPGIEPTTDPYADIVHTDVPPEPVLVYWAYDCDTGRYTEAANQPQIGGGCDQWAINFIERPTNREKNMYYPYLDIVRFQMGKDPN